MKKKISETEDRQKESRREIGQLIQKSYEVMTSHPDECIELAGKAKELSDKAGDRIGLGYALMHLGLGYFHKDELAKALEYYKQAEEIFEAAHDVYGLRSIYNNIGVVYHHWRDRDKALRYYQLNLDLEAELPNPRLNASIMSNIATIHTWARELDLAREWLHKSLAFARQANHPNGEALALNSMAHICFLEDRLDEAQELIERAIQLRRDTGDLIGEINSLESLADIYKKREDYPRALEVLETAMEKARQMDSKHAISHISLMLAELAKISGDDAARMQHLQTCLKHASAWQFRDLEINALRELAQLYEKKRRYKKALETYWRYQDQKNYLINEEKNRTIHQLRMQMEVSEKEHEMEMIRRSNLSLEKKNRLISRQKNKLEKAEKTLLELNRTLEQRVMEEVAKRRAQEEAMIQKSKLESLGRLSAGIAHEINQPLGMISLGIENLLHQIEKGVPNKEYLQKKTVYFTHNIDRIKTIIEHVRLFSRDQQDDNTSKTDMTEIVHNALSMITLQCKHENINIHFEHPPQAVYIVANPFRIEQVVLNLLSNARDAVLERFDIFNDQKSIRIDLAANRDCVLLEIRDNGAGMTEEIRQRVFEPFFTTKSQSKGTGLGLSICYGIINDLGGTLSCESVSGEGSTLRVELPNLFEVTQS